MEDPATTTLSQETPPRETWARQLLKASRTGGAVAASTLLPGEWAKPVVEVVCCGPCTDIVNNRTGTDTGSARILGGFVTPTRAGAIISIQLLMALSAKSDRSL